jgi:hypothetical protein
VLSYLVALILLTGLIWAAMEWVYYRELHYLRECLRLQSVRLVTYWPGMEEWRLAAEKLAKEKARPAHEIVPEAAEWREPEIMPQAIMANTLPEEPLNVVNIMAALEDHQAAREGSGRVRAETVAKAAPHPRRKATRIRRAAS